MDYPFSPPQTDIDRELLAKVWEDLTNTEKESHRLSMAKAHPLPTVYIVDAEHQRGLVHMMERERIATVLDVERLLQEASDLFEPQQTEEPILNSRKEKLKQRSLERKQRKKECKAYFDKHRSHL